MFRLDRLERFALAKMFSLIPAEAASWLFGSRTDVNARGGDIDILVQIDSSPAERLNLSRRLTLAFQEHCDEKIDVVVYPKSELDTAQKAFLGVISRLDLETIVNAPSLDHVALLVRDIESARSVAASWGFPLQNLESFEGEGTTETYVGEPSRGARVLLMEASGPGPYQRALQKRGPGLHHIGVKVLSMAKFLAKLEGTGWFIHPKSVRAIQNGGTIYLARPGAPLLIEVSEAQPQTPAVLAPVVERIQVHVDSEATTKLSTLNIPELSWSANEETGLVINGHRVSLAAL